MATRGQQPTRKQQRETAREQRRAAEAERAAAERRKRQIAMLGAAVAAAVVVVIVAIAVSTSGGGSKGLKKGTQANQTVAGVSSLLNGVPQSGATLGSPTAPVKLQYFGDLECPVCQAFTLSTLPQVVSTYVKPGKLQIQYRSLQTATPDPSTFENQQVAALAAGKQQLLWQYVELFYHEQGQEDTGYVTESYLSGLAQQVPGLNLSAWQTARGDQTLAQQVSADEAAAQQSGYHSTPTLVFTGPKGSKAIVGNAAFSDVQQAVNSVS